MARARSTMRARRLVNTLSVTPMAEMRKMGVSAIWMRWAISTDWTEYVLRLPMARRRLPLDPTESPSREYHDTEYDAVPGKGLEIVAADVAYQGAHGDRRAHEGCDGADADHREIVEFEGVPRLEQLQHRRAEYRGDGQEE